MKKTARILGPILIVGGLTACAGSSAQSAGLSEPDRKFQCTKGGTECRWDDQCCSGRCYVDTGCAG
jgi:hypothetical protein